MTVWALKCSSNGSARASLANEASSLVRARSAMAAAGLVLCTAWYFTILAGFFTLYCPVMYLMFFHHMLYRRLADLLFVLWELYPVMASQPNKKGVSALFQWCFKTKIHNFGDYVDPNENTIIIMNHRTRVDWNYVWIALYHATQNRSTHINSESCMCKEKRGDCIVAEKQNIFLDALDFGGKSKIKFVLKDELKSIPGMGWIMQLNFFLYVKRRWSEDQLSLSQFVDYYSRLQRPCRLVLFPEGTDLSVENRRRSDAFAAVNNLPHYEFVLHPRTTGWAALCARLRTSGLASVYDVTVAYDTPAQTEADLLRGNIPTHVYFHFKRYSIEELPSEDKALRSWINDRWQDKEMSLRTFQNDGQFIDTTTNKAPLEQAPRPLRLAIIGFLFWTLIDILFMYGLLTSFVVQFWVIYHSLLFIFVTWYFGGFHNIQYKLLENIKG